MVIATAIACFFDIFCFLQGGWQDIMGYARFNRVIGYLWKIAIFLSLLFCIASSHYIIAPILLSTVAIAFEMIIYTYCYRENELHKRCRARANSFWQVIALFYAIALLRYIV